MRNFNRNMNDYNRMHDSMVKGQKSFNVFFNLIFAFIAVVGVVTACYHAFVVPHMSNEEYCRSFVARNDMRCVGALSSNPSTVIPVVVAPR